MLGSRRREVPNFPPPRFEATKALLFLVRYDAVTFYSRCHHVLTFRGQGAGKSLILSLQSRTRSHDSIPFPCSVCSCHVFTSLRSCTDTARHSRKKNPALSQRLTPREQLLLVRLVRSALLMVVVISGITCFARFHHVITRPGNVAAAGKHLELFRVVVFFRRCGRPSYLAVGLRKIATGL